ncbi:MAG: sugar phosphate isomerase/epimerase, partial [Chloroflexi bacterium]|nr:sugar phosphate isomerase/epimerase [Chloroflexota bacterium]
TINLHYNHGAMPGSHSASVWQETLESLKRNLEMTKNLGGKVVVLHPGKIDVPTLASPEDGSELIRREAIRNLKRFVGEVAPVAEELGINVCIENLFHDPGYVLQSYEELASVIDDADSPNVGATVDVGHCNRGDGIPDAIRDLGARVRHLHLNDVIDGVDHHEIGTGILDLDEMEPLVSHDLNAEFATLEVGARSPDGEGIILRSREVLRNRYGADVD